MSHPSDNTKTGSQNVSVSAPPTRQPPHSSVFAPFDAPGFDDIEDNALNIENMHLLDPNSHGRTNRDRSQTTTPVALHAQARMLGADPGEDVATATQSSPVHQRHFDDTERRNQLNLELTERRLIELKRQVEADGAGHRTPALSTGSSTSIPSLESSIFALGRVDSPTPGGTTGVDLLSSLVGEGLQKSAAPAAAGPFYRHPYARGSVRGNNKAGDPKSFEVTFIPSPSSRSSASGSSVGSSPPSTESFGSAAYNASRHRSHTDRSQPDCSKIITAAHFGAHTSIIPSTAQFGTDNRPDGMLKDNDEGNSHQQSKSLSHIDPARRGTDLFGQSGALSSPDLLPLSRHTNFHLGSVDDSTGIADSPPRHNEVIAGLSSLLAEKDLSFAEGALDSFVDHSTVTAADSSSTLFSDTSASLGDGMKKLGLPAHIHQSSTPSRLATAPRPPPLNLGAIGNAGFGGNVLSPLTTDPVSGFGAMPNGPSCHGQHHAHEQHHSAWTTFMRGQLGHNNGGQPSPAALPFSASSELFPNLPSMVPPPAPPSTATAPMFSHTAAAPLLPSFGHMHLPSHPLSMADMYHLSGSGGLMLGSRAVGGHTGLGMAMSTPVTPLESNGPNGPSTGWSFGPSCHAPPFGDTEASRLQNLTAQLQARDTAVDALRSHIDRLNAQLMALNLQQQQAAEMTPSETSVTNDGPTPGAQPYQNAASAMNVSSRHPSTGSIASTDSLASVLNASAPAFQAQTTRASTASALRSSGIVGPASESETESNASRSSSGDQYIGPKVLVERALGPRNQEATIVLQQQLKSASPERKQAIVNAIAPHAVQLAFDKHGNFLLQRAIAACPSLTWQLKGSFVQLSLSPYGCHVVQKILDEGEEYRMAIVKEMLDNRLAETLTSRNSIHVWQKLLEINWSSREFRKSIFRRINDTMRGFWARTSVQETGSIICQNIFESADAEDREECITEILMQLRDCAVDQYGVWVAQHLVEHGDPEHRRTAMDRLLDDAVMLTLSQYGQKAIMSALRTGDEIFIRRYVDILCGQEASGNSTGRRSVLVQIGSTPQGLQIVTQLLTSVTSAQREKIIQTVRRNSVFLKGSKTGLKVHQLCGESIATY
ncbi:meiotic PUF protein 1 [Tilletia horrida]|uniref:Meiotic PUF protein 1 n=1 Tax=Tilletia horrida TaxID=155126 RepID=A0AAN6GPF0_9BASI|nr:meiotic PUF protein 1 [Tilletia horrida]